VFDRERGAVAGFGGILGHGRIAVVDGEQTPSADGKDKVLSARGQNEPPSRVLGDVSGQSVVWPRTGMRRTNGSRTSPSGGPNCSTTPFHPNGDGDRLATRTVPIASTNSES
jgi:hypothetical protein